LFLAGHEQSLSECGEAGHTSVWATLATGRPKLPIGRGLLVEERVVGGGGVSPVEDSVFSVS
jgi:hypothetical protein